MKTSMPRSAVLMLVLLCAVTVCALAAVDPPGRSTRAVTAVSAPPSVLSVTTLSGKSFNLKAQRGKWVIVNFWATWCGPCIKEMPTLSAFAAARHDAAVIGLAYEDQPLDTIRAFLKKHPVHYPVARVDPAHPPIGIAMPSVLPTTLLVAPNGRVAKTFVGPLNLRELAAAISAKTPPS